MKLQTIIPIPKEPYNPIDYSSRVVLLGSCFSDSMGALFTYYKFQNLSNPFGVLFQPSAIENIIERTINKTYFKEDELFYLNECWHTFDVHSKLSHPEVFVTLQQLNSALDTLYEALVDATHLFITLGSSWVYRHTATDRLVANCHKVPQKEFQKELLSVDDVEGHLAKTIALVRDLNPKITIVCTVSPVRHIKDGFVENQRSKSHLISGVHEVVDPRKRIHYFPSYELLLDELRDYRYYAEDLLHPNTMAIQYIWERLKSSWIDEKEHPTLDEIAAIQKGLAHRFIHPNTKAEEQFKQQLSDNIKDLQQRYPEIKFPEC